MNDPSHVNSITRRYSFWAGSPRLLLAGVMAGTLLLAACATTPEEKPVEPVPQAENDKDLPNVELTPELFYDILLGEMAGQRGRLDIAVAALSRAAKNSGDPRLASRATQAALYAKMYESARETGAMWVELQPDNLEARETLASILLELNKPLEAHLHLEYALKLAEQQNDLQHVFLRLAGLLSRHNNRQAAFDLMDNLARQYPNEAHAYLALAHLGVRAGDLNKALEGIDHALKLRPGWDDAALYKARILISKHDLPAAEAFYREFVSNYPDSTKIRLNYARFLVDRKQWERARKQFMRVVEDSPDDAESLFAVGLLAVQAERYEEAETYLVRTLELQPDNDQARLYLGQVAEERKDYAAAIRWYEGIASPNYLFEAQARTGVAIARMGDLEKARAFLHEIQAGNEKEQVQLILAEEQVLREAKQYHLAMKVLNVALAKLPEQNDIRYARALVAEKINMFELMESDLRTILKHDPKNAHALNALGYTLADRTDRLKEARKLVELALEQKPNDPFVLDSMGWVEYRSGNYSKAIDFLKRALSLRNDAEISAHLGEVLWVSGDEGSARSVWQRALEQTPDNESLLGVIKKYTK